MTSSRKSDMTTAPTVPSDVNRVEKQLKMKNKYLSELESKAKLFNKMIRSGISTPDVYSFSVQQLGKKVIRKKKKFGDKVSKLAMREKLNDVYSTITIVKRERKRLRRELAHLLRGRRDTFKVKLNKLKEGHKLNRKKEDKEN